MPKASKGSGKGDVAARLAAKGFSKGHVRSFLYGKGFSDAVVPEMLEQLASGKGNLGAMLSAKGLGKGHAVARPAATGSDTGGAVDEPAGKGVGEGIAAGGRAADDSSKGKGGASRLPVAAKRSAFGDAPPWRNAKSIGKSGISRQPAAKGGDSRLPSAPGSSEGDAAGRVAEDIGKGNVSRRLAVDGSSNGMVAARPAATGSDTGGAVDEPAGKGFGEGLSAGGRAADDSSKGKGGASRLPVAAKRSTFGDAPPWRNAKRVGKSGISRQPAAKGGMGGVSATMAAAGLGKGDVAAILTAKGFGKGGKSSMKGEITESSLAGNPDKSLLWHDPEIGNTENSALGRELESLDFRIVKKRKYDEAIQFLRDPSKTENRKWLLLTSGENGESLVSAADAEESVGAIIVRCNNVDRHRQWSGRFNKVRKVTCDTSEVRSLAAKMGNLMEIARSINVSSSFGSSFDSTRQMEIMNMLIPGVAAFASPASLERRFSKEDTGERYGAALVFRCIVGKLSQAPLPTDFMDLRLGRELESCLDENLISNESWNMLWASDKWLADSGNGITPTSLGQKLSLVYTSDYIYKKFNARLASADLGPIVNVLGAWCNAARRAPHMRHSGTVLFRGVKKDSLDPDAYRDNSSCFWTTTSSCTTALHVAEHFAGEDGVVYHITRRSRPAERHLDIDFDLDPEWSHYGAREHEVLVFPYLHLQVTRKERRGSRLWIYVHEKPSVFMAKENDIASAIDDFVDVLMRSGLDLGDSRSRDVAKLADSGLSGDAKKRAYELLIQQIAAYVARSATMILESCILSEFVDVRASTQVLQAALQSEAVLAEAGRTESTAGSVHTKVLAEFSKSLRLVLKQNLCVRD